MALKEWRNDFSFLFQWQDFGCWLGANILYFCVVVAKRRLNDWAIEIRNYEGV
jgi:hypothetical protein